MKWLQGRALALPLSTGAGGSSTVFTFGGLGGLRFLICDSRVTFEAVRRTLELN